MKTLTTHRLAATLAAVLATTSVAAQERPAEPDLSALELADKAPTQVVAARDWHLSSEFAAGSSVLRSSGERVNSQRVSLDLQVDKSLGQGWRGLFSDQLDLRRELQPGERASINTVKEAYLSWADEGLAADIGRINARYGVALGYNPTDYFRIGANRSIVAIDPVSLKTRRQGSVMLRGQRLWDNGSLTALFSPKLNREPHKGAFDLDFNATNSENRWLVAFSQKAGNFNPQVLLSKTGAESPQVGLNLTTVVGQGGVAYFEWSGGRSRSQLAQALSLPQDETFHSRVASGFTYTALNKLSLTLEYQYNGAALEKGASDMLVQRNPLQLFAYRQWVQNRLELVNKQSWFAYASWQDALMNQLDLNAMMRQNTDDNSRLAWVEARYHWKRTDLAVQWQQHQGAQRSEFGALPQKDALQVLVRYFF
ncbi:MAG: hypothetical protein JWQ01_3937 [Massilia sp.]|nr:hypothetical protein [Massilia sp.]